MYGKFLAQFLAFGVIGWAVESSLDGRPHGSKWLPAGVPFVPMYGLGGVLLGQLAPAIRDAPVLGRAGIYAVATTGFELLGCQLDRWAGKNSWDYGGGLCVDGRHTAAWTTLALIAEPFLR